jgi:hypothetical protein
MDDTDKIVAAILAAAYASKNIGATNATQFVQALEEISSEMMRREKEKSGDFAGALELAIENKKKGF